MPQKKPFYDIRPIKEGDDKGIADVVKQVLMKEYSIKENQSGSSLSDPCLPHLNKHYKKEDKRRGYFVLVAIDDNGERVVGGGGFGKTKDDDTAFEIQKFYFSEEARGKGMGKQLFYKMLDTAFGEKFNYQTAYLKTMARMESAMNIYKIFGFEDITQGNQHHLEGTVSDVYMRLTKEQWQQKKPNNLVTANSFSLSGKETTADNEVIQQRSAQELPKAKL